jgi:hypothetical protein
MKRCQINVDRAVDAQVASERQQGDAGAWVLREFPRQLHACRQRAKRTSTLLVVLIDADKWTVAERRNQLNQQLKQAGHEQLESNDPNTLLIPRRHVETWICALLGQSVTEEDDCKDWKQPTKDDFRRAANTAYDWARDNATPGPTCVDSLRIALPEWRKVG